MTSKNSKKGHDYHQVRKEEGSTGVPTIRLLPKVSALALIFGMGSWIAITGLWLEMPLLIERLPEGWRLASYLNIMIQIANIGPLLYWFARKKRLLNEITATHIQMSIGIASCLVLILAWDWTVEIRGKRHSLVLFVATFGLALVDCTSSVTFLPFMARFDSGYMTPYLVGEGLSGFIPSMFALIQGVGENRKECLELTSSADIALNATAVGSVVNASAPFREQLANLTTTLQVLDTDQLERSASSASSLIEPIFSVEVFFLSLFSTLLISYIGFCTLQLLPEAKQEMANARKRQQLKANAKKLKVYKKVVYEERMMEEAAAAAAAAETSEENGVVGPMINSDDFDCIPLDDEDEKEEVIIFGEKDSDDDSFGNRRFNRINSVASEGATEQFDKQKRTYYYLLALMFLNCFTTFGFFPPVQPYSALPYGVEVLHYIVVLSGLAYPTGCFFGMLVEAKSVRLINLLTAIGTTLALYILACALMSPSPPLVDSPVGGILMVLCWIAYVGILSYSKTMITLWICDYNSRKGMFWVGMNQKTNKKQNDVSPKSDHDEYDDEIYSKPKLDEKDRLKSEPIKLTQKQFDRVIMMHTRTLLTELLLSATNDTIQNTCKTGITKKTEVKLEPKHSSSSSSSLSSRGALIASTKPSVAKTMSGSRNSGNSFSSAKESFKKGNKE